MKILFRTLFFYIFIFYALVLKSQDISITGTVSDGSGNTVKFSRIHGGQEFVTDSAILNNKGELKFLIKSPYTGMYRLSLSDSTYADFIINNGDVMFLCSAAAPIATMNIVKSEENKVYYTFLNSAEIIDSAIDSLMHEGQLLYDNNPVGNKNELLRLSAEIEKLEDSRMKSAQSAAEANPKLFVSKILKAYVIPDYSAYLKNKKQSDYKNKFEFLKYHYLDNVDFSDSSMLNTPVLYRQCGEYIRNFANPASVEVYKKLVDILMGKVSENLSVKGYITGVLLETFDSPAWEDVYVYIADTYLAGNTCVLPFDTVKVTERASRIMKLKPGNTAPDFSILSWKGDTIKPGEVGAKYDLIFFWASWCEFCEEAMPSIKKIYDEYNHRGLQVISISLDSIASECEKASFKYKITWDNSCDITQQKSKIIKEYNVTRTPLFFVLDSKRNIIARFQDARSLMKTIEQLQW